MPSPGRGPKGREAGKQQQVTTPLPRIQKSKTLSLTGDGRRRNNVDELPWIWILPVQRHVEALLVEVQDGFLAALCKLLLDVLLLLSQRLLDGCVWL